MIALTPITNTEIFALIAVLVFKLMSRKVNRNRTEKTVETFKKQAAFSENSKFHG